MQQALFELRPEYERTGQRTLVGIARLAAQSVPLEAKKQVEYLAIPTRSILNRCSSQRMPFEYTINPYRGCEFGCKYCYARYTHEYMELDGADFENRIFAKEHAAELLRAELRKIAPTEVAIGTATDPYQPAERRFEVTRALLRVLAEDARGFRFSLVTKSDFVTRDLDLLQEIGRRNRLQVSFTITTLNERLARALEPRAPRPELRLRALETLSQAGICTGVFAAPVLPGITDNPNDLEAIAREAAACGASHFLANPLFLTPAAQRQFFPFLEKEFPALVEKYREKYERRMFLRGEYPRRLKELVTRLRRKYDLSETPHDYPAEGLQGPSQGQLF